MDYYKNKTVNAEDSNDTLIELEPIFYTKKTGIQCNLLSTYILLDTILDMGDTYC